MWCELVLNGVGGRTIAEAKERLSHPEFILWTKYRNRRGSLNVGMRVERGAALMASIYSNIHSKDANYKISDFMPHENEKAISLEDAISSWA